MQILIINASHRQGNTDIATKKVIVQLQKSNHEVKEIFLRDIKMKMPDGCDKCAEAEICPNLNDEFSEEIEPTLHNFDIYILATPTWSDNITPLAKIFWDRIVHWCHEDRMYLKGKKLALITHGMAGSDSWNHCIDWIKSVCEWEEANYAGALTFKSGGQVDSINLSEKNINSYISNLVN